MSAAIEMFPIVNPYIRNMRNADTIIKAAGIVVMKDDDIEVHRFNDPHRTKQSVLDDLDKLNKQHPRAIAWLNDKLLAGFILPPVPAPAQVEPVVEPVAVETVAVEAPKAAPVEEAPAEPPKVAAWWRKVEPVETPAESPADAEAQEGGDSAAHTGADEGSAKEPAASTARRSSLIMTCAADVKPEKIQWLWPHRFPLGKFSLIVGHPGKGKSQLSLHMTAQITNGGWWPNGEGQVPRGSVVILSAEDGAGDTVVPRLIAAGADLSRVHIVEAVKVPMGNGSQERQFNIVTDMAALCDAIDQIGDVKLVIIDPITAYLGGGKEVDSHNNSEVRAALVPLQTRAAKVGFAAVGISHMSKGGGVEALMRVMGSVAFVAAARAAFLVVGDTGNERTLFIPMKSNLGMKKPGLAFKVVSKTIADGIDTSCIEWDADPVTIGADEALAAAAGRQGGDRGEQSSLEEATGFLKDVLRDGPLRSTEVYEQAKGAGVAPRTVRRAQKALGIKPRRDEDPKSGKLKWWWELPKLITFGHD